MPKHVSRQLILVICFSVCQTMVTTAADWPHWRGDNRNDTVDEYSGWNGTKWSLSKAVWSKNVGEGCSSPIVVDGKIYVMGWNNKRVTLTCLDANYGKQQWSQSFSSPQYGRYSIGDKGVYSGMTGSPEFDIETGYLYALSSDGDLYCWNTTQRGKPIWHFNLYEKYKVTQRPNVGRRKRMHRDYGYTSSPLLYKEQLIVEVGDDKGTLMAFDKRTGKCIWKSAAHEPAGHTGGPVFIDVDGLPCALTLAIRNLIVVRLDKGNAGKTVATFPWTTDFANNIATPTVFKNDVLITSAYNHYAMCKVRITRSGAKKVWEQKNPSGVCSPLVHEGNIYWAWRGIHCVDFKTGTEKWTGGKVGSVGSCVLTNDNRLLTWANRGDLILSETTKRSPGKYKELATQKRIFNADAWPHLVLANGKLYCKDRNGNMKCFKVGG